MTAPSDDLNDLEGDTRHLSTLINTIFDVAIEIPMPTDEAPRRPFSKSRICCGSPAISPNA
jgi:hypothetical protein